MLRVLLVLLLFPSFLGAQVQEKQSISVDSALAVLSDLYSVHCLFESTSLNQSIVETKLSYSSFNEGLEDICSKANLDYRFIRSNTVMIREKEIEDEERGKSAVLLIRDRDTKDHLSFALIYDPLTNQSSVTDNFGLSTIHYKGEACFNVQYLGYNQGSFCLKGKEDSIVVFMTKMSYEAGVIELETEKALETLDSQDNMARTYSSNKLETIGGQTGGNDPIKGLHFQAGILNATDKSSKLEVRGGKNSENRVVLNGLFLYNIEHYFGLFSNISGSLADELTLYKDIYPVEYGGVASSLIDIKSLNSTKKSNGELSISNLLFSGRINHFLTDKIETTMAFRSTMGNIAQSQFIGGDANEGITQLLLKRNSGAEKEELKTDSKPISGFSDAYLALIYHINEKNRIRVNGFYSSDHYKNDIIHRPEGRRRPIAEIMDKERWESVAYGIDWKHEVSKKWNHTTSLSSSFYDEFIHKQFKTRIPGQEELGIKDDYNTSSTIAGARFITHWKYQLSEQARWNFGLEGLLESSDFTSFSSTSRFIHLNSIAFQQTTFAGVDLNWKNWVGILGLRATYFDVESKMYWAPRLAIARKIGENAEVGTTWRLENQFMREINIETPSGRSIEYNTLANNKRIPVLFSNQASLWGQFVKGKYSGKASLYIKHYDGVIEQLPARSGLPSNGGTSFRNDELILLKGRGKNVGLEISNTFYLKPIEININYTWSKNTVAFARVQQGMDIPAPNDRRHQLSALISYQLTKRFRLFMEYNYATGLPYNDISTIQDGGMDRRGDFATFRTKMQDPYYALDLGLAYHWEGKQLNYNLDFSVYNLTNKQNFLYEEYFYSIRDNTRENNLPSNFILGYEQNMLGITPSLSFTVKW